MKIDKYLHIYKEETLVKMGKNKCIAISRSYPLDDVNRLDISIFRLFHDTKGPFRYLVANMFYWYGKTQNEEELILLLLENRFLLDRLSKTDVALAQRMLKLGKSFPYWTEDDIHFIERIWKLPKAFMWVDPIMYDSYEIESFLNIVSTRKTIIEVPGYKAYKRDTLPYSRSLLGDIIKGFKYSAEPDFRPFYNRKTDKVSLYLPDDEKNEDDCPLVFYIEYKELNRFLVDAYGEKCAYVFATVFLIQEKEQFDKKDFIEFITAKYGEKCSLLVAEAIINGTTALSKIPSKYNSFKQFLKETGWLDVFAGFSGNIHKFQNSKFAVDFLSIIKATDKYFNDISMLAERDYIACWLASQFISYCKELK